MTDGGYNPNGMVEIAKQFTQVPMDKFIKMPVDALGLYPGIINTLAFNDIFTVRQLAECDEDRVAKMTGIGIVRRNIIKQRLEENGLCFGCVFDGENLVAERLPCLPAEAAAWLRGLAATGRKQMKSNRTWTQEFHGGNLEMFEECVDLIERMHTLIDEFGQLIPCEKPEIGPMPKWIRDLIDRRNTILAGK